MKPTTCSLCGSVYEPASGKALRAERRRRGLTLDAVGKAMGLTRSAVSQLELGQVKGTPLAVARYEAALKVAVPSRRKRRRVSKNGAHTPAKATPATILYATQDADCPASAPEDAP